MKTPTFPRSDTLAARSLMRLLCGQKITHRDFQNDTATYRLSGYIENLRHRHNWLIETHVETAQTGDPIGRRAKYGRYQIAPEILTVYQKDFGERLDNFIEAVHKFESRAPKSQ